jgi:hypothetical protein
METLSCARTTNYFRLLRGIIVLFAVITAVPVIFCTITAFVRYQVTLPKVLTLPNSLATASTNAPKRATIAEPTQQQSMPLQPTDQQDAKQTEGAAPEGSSFVEHAPDMPPSAPSASQTADTSSPLAAISNSATPTGHDFLPPFAANDVGTAGTTGAMQPAAATEAETDVLSASAPLSGPIPLPRPRPHDAGRLHTADRVPSPVPTRPRPTVDDSGARQGTTTDIPPQQR